MRTLLALACASSLALAQTPRFLHAQFETRAAQAILADQMRAAAPAGSPQWWGYTAPALRSGGDDCGVEYLEQGRQYQSENNATSPNDQNLVLLYRIDHGKVEKLRISNTACQLDAGGLPVVWLTGVTADQSVALQVSLMASAPELANQVTVAVALTDGPAAEKALEGFAAPSQPEKVREQAVFWLGNQRGHDGFLALQRLDRNDTDEALRDRITFALSQSHDLGALPELIRMARSDASPKVRGQALFWLGQKAGRQAEAAITDAIRDDPDTQVKVRAVFGLSQLPHGDGVPLLIQVAESNSNPAVRKQAMFWLGQSKDPRALDFFEKVLAKP